MLGDHIRALKNGRWTHAIDLGDQRVLFLVDQPGLPPADRLRRVYRPDFTAGATRVELVVHRERTYPSKAVVARAWSRFMDPSVLAMFADSEQFAAWCKIGRLPEVAPPPPARPARKAAAAKPAAVRPAPAARAARKKAAARKPVVKKGAAAKPAAKKAPARKVAAKKAPAAAPRRGAGKKTPARPAARKAAQPARKGPAKAAARKPVAARARQPAKRPAAKKKGRR